MQKVTCLLIFFISVQLKLNAQDKTISFGKPDDVLVIGESIYVLEDKMAKLTFEDVIKPENKQSFKLYDKSVLNFGITHSDFWLRFTIQNTTEDNCLLEIANATVENIEIYLAAENGEFQVKKMGYAYPFSQREYQVNTFLTKIIPAGNTKIRTVYLRINSSDGLLLPMRLGNEKTFFALRQPNNLLNGIYLGLVLITLFYNGGFYFLLKEKAYLHYSFYLLFFVLVNMSYLTGYTFQYIWADFPLFNYYLNIPVGLGFISLISFTTIILETRLRVPFLHKGFYIFYVFYILLILINLSGQWKTANQIAEFLNLLLSLYLFLVGLVCYAKGEQQARLYTIAIGFFIAGILVIMFVILGLLPFNFFTRNVLILGSSIETVLLSLTLANKVRLMNIAKKSAEAAILTMVEEEKERLEYLVEERIQEIATQNEEITAQNEEIISQNEELSVAQEEITAQRDLLYEQNEQLKEAQTIIKEYNQKLEIEVVKRTEELRKANETLVQYNQQLEQFAFITAHNLRSPVARILGLGSLIELPNVDLQEILSIVDKLVVSTRQLDDIIKDLNTILAVNKSTGVDLVSIYLPEMMEKVTYLLQKEITESKAELSTDFSETEVIQSLPPYLSSILYNLVNNALKYKHPQRKPQVHIKATSGENFVCLSVSDNGLGIDLNQYGNKLFTLYKRFHYHVEGKGLGLYLVKTQIEALNGKIEVKSEVEQGTTFLIYLPVKKS